MDLSENALVKFPEQLLHLVERLDLTYNKIKIIPSSVVKRLDWNIDQRLEVTSGFISRAYDPKRAVENN